MENKRGNFGKLTKSSSMTLGRTGFNTRKSNQNNFMKNALETMALEIEQKNEQLLGCKEYILKQKAKIRCLKEKLEEERDSKKRSKQKLFTLQNFLEDREHELGETRNKLFEQQIEIEQVSVLRKSLREFKSTELRYEQKNQDLRNSIQILEQRNSDISSLQKIFKKKISELKAELKKSQCKILDVESEMRISKSTNENISEHLEELKKQNQKFLIEREKFERSTQRLRSKIDSLQKSVVYQKQKIEDQEEAIFCEEILKKKVKEVSGAVQDLVDSRMMVTMSLIEFSRVEEKLKDFGSSVNEKIGRICGQLETKLAEEKNSGIKKLGIIEELKKTEEQNKEEIGKLKLIMEQLRKEMDVEKVNRENELKLLEEESEDKFRELERTKKLELEEVQKEVKEKDREILVLRKTLDEFDGRIERIISKNSKKNELLAKVKEDMKLTASQRNMYRKLSDCLLLENDKNIKEIDRRGTKIDAITRNLRELQEEVVRLSVQNATKISNKRRFSLFPRRKKPNLSINFDNLEKKKVEKKSKRRNSSPKIESPRKEKKRKTKKKKVEEEMEVLELIPIGEMKKEEEEEEINEEDRLQLM